MIETVALVATLLGGVAAVGYFWEKISLRELAARFLRAKAPAIPAESAAIFDYGNADQRLITLTKKIAERRGYEISNFDSQSAWLKEKIKKMGVSTIRELDGYVKKYGDLAVRLSDYHALEGKIDTGMVLSDVLDIVLMERLGLEEFKAFHESLQYSSGGAMWAKSMYDAYQQIKKHG